jgi:phenylpropionate dioxygenase-like ring-hydroxylating dioxygenase large terminal subunit
MSSEEPRLRPPDTKGNVSVARIPNAWYVACFSSELGKKPVARTLLGVPIVLFRGAGGAPAALLDRCPHRNVPLSLGCVAGEHLQCVYHGWEFDARGVCRRVPGLLGDQESKGRRVEAFPTREHDGCVWVWASTEVEPTTEPFRFPLVDKPGYTTVHRRVQAEASVHAVVENALDVPHTAFLHKGLFRGAGDPNEIEVVVRRGPDRVEAEYIGEPRVEGLVGKILSPSGGIMTHFDRFILPSIAQVEYRIGDENHILVCAACTPVSDFETVLHAVISFKLRIPHWLVKPFLTPIALRVFKQDAEVLKTQTATIRAFGGEQYVSTEIDVLGNHIWRLLRQAERGASGEVGEVVEKRLKLLA